jgi:hypothetical protein
MQLLISKFIQVNSKWTDQFFDHLSFVICQHCSVKSRSCFLAFSLNPLKWVRRLPSKLCRGARPCARTLGIIPQFIAGRDFRLNRAVLHPQSPVPIPHSPIPNLKLKLNALYTGIHELSLSSSVSL